MTNQPHHPEREALWRAVDLAGGQSALARLCGIAQSSISFYLYRARKGVPGDIALIIERETSGSVSRYELRPDLYPVPAPPPRQRAAPRKPRKWSTKPQKR